MSTSVLNSSKKWELALIAAALFLIISAPFTYKVTEKVSNLIGFDTTSDGGPTIAGLGLHFVVYLLLFRLILVWVV
jgi:hypothetical protein